VSYQFGAEEKRLEPLSSSTFAGSKIDLLENEILSQETQIPNLIERLPKEGRGKRRKEPIFFVGAGYSLAVSVITERISSFHVRSMDPYELLMNHEIADGGTVFIVSVSGKTKTNIALAKKLSSRGHTVAITANEKSELAKSVAEIVPISLTKFEWMSPGTVSFSATLLACLREIRSLAPVDNLRELMEKARKWVESSAETKIKGTVHFVGSGYGFGLGIYGAAKTFETTGRRASYEETEEFSHMQLFSLQIDDGDAVFLIPGRIATKEEELADHLSKFGMKVLLIPSISERTVEDVLFKTFALQMLALKFAKAERTRKEFAFLEKETLLKISNVMIY
jgi:fructoselysine-6-P-deglycase FrlB-like protein